MPLVLGGSFGHLLVIDYALKPVLSALGATDILSGAYVLDTQIEYAENNQYLISSEADERLDRVLDKHSQRKGTTTILTICKKDLKNVLTGLFIL